MPSPLSRRPHRGGDLFDQVVAPDALAKAWKRTRRNKGSAGGDGQSIARFGSRAQQELKKLRRDLLDGTYRPGPLRRVTIPKKSGGERVLAIPCVRDRVAQASAALVLSRALDRWMSHASFAYRPGLSAAHAAGAITTWRLYGYRWVAEGDIEAFFDELPHAVVRDALRDGLDAPSPRLSLLLNQWLDGFGEGRGVAQGAPISPVLANIALTPVDRALQSTGRKLIRYADDFVILTRSEEAAVAALERMATALAERGLALNASKSRVSRFGLGVAFLGFRFDGDRVALDQAA